MHFGGLGMATAAFDYAICLGCSDRGPEQECCIFLPHQSPLGAFSHPRYLPTGEWPATFLCLRHGHSCVRSADSVHLGIEMLAPDQSIPPLWRIECECGHESCGKRHAIYTAKMPDWASIVRWVLKTNPVVPCDGHELVWREELMRVLNLHTILQCPNMGSREP
jgi:hypothetical protein